MAKGYIPKCLGLQAPNFIGGEPNKIGSHQSVMATEGTPERLKRLRLLLGHNTQQAMADFLEIEFNRYNNMERGSPLSHDVAVRICQKVPGMTLDWLYFGKADGLPLELARRMGEAPRPSERRPRRG